MSTNNSILMLRPYKVDGKGNWVFDEPLLNIRREPFVMNFTEMIDVMTADLKEPEKGFSLLFSEKEFPETQKFNLIEEAMGGGWYQWEQTGMVGWLCSCLPLIMGSVPPVIYAQAKP